VAYLLSVRTSPGSMLSREPSTGRHSIRGETARQGAGGIVEENRTESQAKLLEGSGNAPPEQ
jgi:hypothetical protein